MTGREHRRGLRGVAVALAAVVDPRGRVAVLHSVNIVYKRPPYVPEVHYPDSYRVIVAGARIRSARDSDLLVLQRTKQAQEVSVTVRPR